MDTEKTSMAEAIAVWCIILIILFLFACIVFWLPGWLCERIETDRVPHVAMSLNPPNFIPPERQLLSK